MIQWLLFDQHIGFIVFQYCQKVFKKIWFYEILLLMQRSA